MSRNVQQRESVGDLELPREEKLLTQILSLRATSWRQLRSNISVLRANMFEEQHNRKREARRRRNA